ncbi:MAG TPA: hypothetical protein VGQ57_17465, partial [Polyangiaceae bacterium]|nr:hypothetical protein [Polyangiaceae bacterium]
MLSLALGLTGSGGCAQLFGIDVPPLRAQPGQGGEAGGDVEAAGALGGELGSGAGGAGVGAGGPENGGASGGRAGAAAGSTGHGSPDVGDTAGAAGAPEAVFPEPGSPCRREGAVACAAAASFETLRCERGRWKKGLACAPGDYCDRRTGACGAPFPGCSPDTRGACSDDHHTFTACGPDLVTAELETCVFDCLDDQGCTAPAHGELTLEKPPRIVSAGAFWPGPRVPVCFTCAPEDASFCASDGGFDDALAAARAAVQDEVERTWGHAAGVGFTGWDACGD